MKFPLALPLAAAVLLAGCQMGADSIDVRPSPAVRYATQTVNPAVVQLNVVTEVFIGGQPRSVTSLGSGFIIDRQGRVLTNFHVAGQAKKIEITLANQEHVTAKLIGSDHWTDLALVQLDMADIAKRHLSFDIARLGDSAQVTLAEPVMAIGNPYGLSRTVTSGIISNTNRAFDAASIDGYETGWFNNWLQTDAAINPGNSGGPLVDLRGEVIGINTRGISDGNNLGFAIPINVAKDVMKDLLDHGKVTRSYAGLQLQPLQDFESHYGLERNQGVLVAGVEWDSPARAAGIEVGDIILAIDGKPVNVRFSEQLAIVQKMISQYGVGSTIHFTIRRATAAATRPSDITLSVKTEKLESVVTVESSIEAWGLSVRDITHAYMRSLHKNYVPGVLVTGTRAGLPADAATIQGGDIIVRVDDKPVLDIQSLKDAVKAWEKDPRPILVSVTRDRGGADLVVKPLR